MKYLFYIILLILSASTYGQNSYIGLKVGSSWSNQSGPGSIHGGEFFRNGVAFSLSYENYFKNQFSFGVNFDYSQRGYKYDLIFTDVNGIPTGQKVQASLNYNYMSLPLKVGKTFGNKIYGNVSIGIVPSMLLNARFIVPEYEWNNGTILASDEDLSEQTKKMDLSGQIELGGGCKINERTRLFSSFIFQKSFTNIGKIESAFDADNKHYGFILSMELQFSFKKNSTSLI